MNYDYDILFIGAGPAGYVGAIRARQLGLRAALVERDKAGGVCLNIGCIPSKALIEQATRFRVLDELAAFGVQSDRTAFDYAKVNAVSRAAADRLSRGVDFLIKKNGIDYLAGTATLDDAHTVTLRREGSADRRISAYAVVLATGSRPRQVPGFEFDEDRVMSSTGFLLRKKLPRSLIILGAGAIGLEAAYVMNAFGVQVAVVEMLDRILPMEDGEAAAVVRGEFEKRGVRFHTATRAFSLDTSAPDRIKLAIGGAAAATAAESIEAEAVLVSVGRSPNTEGLGLEGLGVRLQKGCVPVGDYYESSAAGLYAVGDIVSGEAQLAHVASAQAELVAAGVAWRLGKAPEPRERRVPAALVPQAVYCEPQVASFGPREEALKAAGRDFRSSRFPFRGVGKAVAVGMSEGFVKILSDPRTGEILGAGVVGAQATELIHELLLAAASELTLYEVADLVHAHPTFSEGVKEAALAALDRALHV